MAYREISIEDRILCLENKVRNLEDDFYNAEGIKNELENFRLEKNTILEGTKEKVNKLLDLTPPWRIVYAHHFYRILVLLTFVLSILLGRSTF